MMFSGKSKRATRRQILLVSLCALAIAGLSSRLLHWMAPTIMLASGDSVPAVEVVLPSLMRESVAMNWLVSFLLIYVGVWIVDRVPADDGDDTVLSGYLLLTGIFCYLSAVLSLVGGWVDGVIFGFAIYIAVLVLSLSAVAVVSAAYLCIKWCTYPVRYCWRRWGRPDALSAFIVRLKRYFEGDAS